MFDPARHCIYCEGRRGDSQFSKEHIWPAALGGDACPEIFRTFQVCRRCNSLAGQWADGAFLKSWFLQNEAGVNSLLYMNPDQPGVAPLAYMGFDEEIVTADDEICERWIGPAGAHIYHIHLRDEERWHSFAGGDFLRRKRSDAGRAYIVLTSPTPYWALTALLSFVARFPEARRRCLTTVIGLPDNIKVLMPDAMPITAAEAREIAFIRSRPDDRMQHMRFAIQVDFSDRFLAKVSIGLAHTVLGPVVSASPYLAQLRRLLWSRGSEERENLAVRGTGFWAERGSDDQLPEFVGWRGAWVIMLQAFPEGFALVLCTPSGRLMTMMISDDPSLWPPHIGPGYGQGIVHLVVPQRSRAFGPIPVPQFISHKLGHMRQPDLSALEVMKTDPACLPPMRPTAASDSEA